jgi:tetratricopeptide (TPR) repeat protein
LLFKRRHDAAIAEFERAFALNPNFIDYRYAIAGAYGQSGQLEEARAEAAEVLRINPGFTIERHKRIFVYKDPKDLEHRLDGLRKAGLPKD